MEAVALLVMILAIYFLPTICASLNHQRNTMAIFLLNFFLGWTLVGWVVAICMAFWKESTVTSQGGKV